MLSKYFRNVIPHSVVAALGPHFHFCTMLTEEGGGDRKKKAGRSDTCCGVIQNQVGLQLAPPRPPSFYSKQVRANPFSLINQSRAQGRLGMKLLKKLESWEKLKSMK